jgi:hypothetical protein
LTVFGLPAASLSQGVDAWHSEKVSWFDITCSVAFGQRPEPMAPLQPKRLKSKDPRLVKRCHKRAKAKMLKNGFQSRFDASKLHSKSKWVDQAQKRVLSKVGVLKTGVFKNG